MISLLLNIFVAVIWLFLWGDTNFSLFIMGWLMGYAFAWSGVKVRLLPDDGYIRRTLGSLIFAGIFLREFIKACWVMIYTVLLVDPKSLEPNFLTMDVSDLSPIEILILTHTISLTPGTTSVDLDEDMKTLTIHALDASDPKGIRRDIDEVFKTSILRFTR